MILQLLQEHGISPKRVSSHQGGEYHSPCPRCGGTDRFHAWPEQNEGQGSFWCRQCDLGGDAIKFLMEYNGLSFRDAATRTGKELDAPQRRYTPAVPKTDQPAAKDLTPREITTPQQNWQLQAHKLILHAAEALQQNPEQLQYLQTRGISPHQAMKWSLGFVGGDKPAVFSARSKWGLEPKQNNKKPDALWIPRGIVIPNIIGDEVNSIRIRRPKQDRTGQLADLHYHVMPGSGTAPLLSYHGQRTIVVVEAQLDAILVDQYASDIAGVLALGNDSARPDERAHQALKQASLILVALDNDDSGQQSAQKWLDWYDTATICPVPQGKDPGDFHQDHNGDIRHWLCQHIPAVWTAPKKPRPTATKPTSKKEEKLYAIKRRKDGSIIALVEDPSIKESVARQNNCNVITYAEVEMLEKMEPQAREQWLLDNDPRREWIHGDDHGKNMVLQTAHIFKDGILAQESITNKGETHAPDR
jgi:DNA primase